jgi:hypothetical protein
LYAGYLIVIQFAVMLVRFFGNTVAFAVILFSVFDECYFYYWLCTWPSDEPPSQRISGVGEGVEMKRKIRQIGVTENGLLY